ncbi:MAG TPA: glycosyltransferase [Pyrinomonadaceae bacterium]|nr:glycosyltransferase [Pyrinomonadaceae bacterium]
MSYAFPPFNSIGGVRVGKTAKYLLKLGHDVRVLTAQNQPFHPTLPVELPAERVLYTKSLNLRKPAEVALRKSANAEAESRMPRGGRFKALLKRALGFPLRTLVYFPDANVGWLPYAVSAGSSLLQDWKADLILASSPPPTSLLVAHKLARKFNVPWIADMRDLWVDHHYYKQPRWRRAAETKMERRVLSSAAGLVTVSEPLAETLRAKYGKPTAVVLNGFDITDYPSGSGLVRNNGVVKILYTGATYPGGQDPSALFEALRRLGPLGDKVRVKFYGSFLNTIRETAAAHDVAHVVEVNAPIPYKESLKAQTEADILLLLLWTDPAQRGVYTGKLFEYIGARRPVLAIGGADCVAADLIRDRHAGVILDDPGEIKLQLERWIQMKDQTGGIPRLPDESVAGISREEQVAVLEDFLRTTLRHHQTNQNRSAPGEGAQV